MIQWFPLIEQREQYFPSRWTFLAPELDVTSVMVVVRWFRCFAAVSPRTEGSYLRRYLQYTHTLTHNGGSCYSLLEHSQPVPCDRDLRTHAAKASLRGASLNRSAIRLVFCRVVPATTYPAKGSQEESVRRILWSPLDWEQLHSWFNDSGTRFFFVCFRKIDCDVNGVGRAQVQS